LDVNLAAPYALSCLVAPHMRQGGGRSIVNVASVMALRSIAQIADAAYVASKAGLIGLTRELASQWGRYGIRVNAVAPGFFASEMTAGLGEDADSFPDWLTEQIPLGRGGRAGELDQSILYLLGAGSSFVTGQVLTVDGGMATRSPANGVAARPARAVVRIRSDSRSAAVIVGRLVLERGTSGKTDASATYRRSTPR